MASSESGEEAERKRPVPSTATKAEKLKLQGNSFLKTGRLRDAIEAYTSAIDLDPENPAYYSNRAAVHLKMGNNHLAIRDCRAALAINPHHSKTLCRLGVALMNVDKAREARESFESAVRIQPGNATYLHNLRLCQEKVLQDGPGAEEEQEETTLVSSSAKTGENESTAEPGVPIPSTDFPSFVQSNLNAGVVPDIGALIQDPMFMQITQRILSNDTLVNAIREQAEEVRNSSGTDGHNVLGNRPTDQLQDDPMAPSLAGPLRAVRNLVNYQREDPPGRTPQGGKAPGPPDARQTGRPQGTTANNAAGSAGTNEDQNRRDPPTSSTRPAGAAPGARARSAERQPQTQQPTPRPPLAAQPPQPGQLPIPTPVPGPFLNPFAPVGHGAPMPPIDDIDLEQLLNDPVVMETANRVLANPEIQRILTEIMLTMLEAPVLVPPPEILAAMEAEQRGQLQGNRSGGRTAGSGPNRSSSGPNDPSEPQAGVPHAHFIFITSGDNPDPLFGPLLGPPTPGGGSAPDADPGAPTTGKTRRGPPPNPFGPPPDGRNRTVEDIMRRIQIETGQGLSNNPPEGENFRIPGQPQGSEQRQTTRGKRPPERIHESTAGTADRAHPRRQSPGGAAEARRRSNSSDGTKGKSGKKPDNPEAMHAAPAVVDEEDGSASSNTKDQAKEGPEGKESNKDKKNG